MRIILAGAGAFEQKHLEAIAAIDEVEVVSLIDPVGEKTAELARQYHNAVAVVQQ